MKKDVEGIIRKRSLIAKTRKTVFMWVAGASCVIGAVVVVAVLLVQTILFKKTLAVKPHMAGYLLAQSVGKSGKA